MKNRPYSFWCHNILGHVVIPMGKKKRIRLGTPFKRCLSKQNQDARMRNKDKCCVGSRGWRQCSRREKIPSGVRERLDSDLQAPCYHLQAMVFLLPWNSFLHLLSPSIHSQSATLFFMEFLESLSTLLSSHVSPTSVEGNFRILVKLL